MIGSGTIIYGAIILIGVLVAVDSKQDISSNKIHYMYKLIYVIIVHYNIY